MFNTDDKMMMRKIEFKWQCLTISIGGEEPRLSLLRLNFNFQSQKPFFYSSLRNVRGDEKTICEYLIPMVNGEI